GLNRFIGRSRTDAKSSWLRHGDGPYCYLKNPGLTSPTELAVGGSRFFRSGRLKRSETVGRRPSMPENVIATLIQPQKSTKTRPKERRLPPFQQSCHLLGYPRAQLRRGCGSQHVPASQLVPDHTKHASPTTHAQSP